MEGAWFASDRRSTSLQPFRACTKIMEGLVTLYKGALLTSYSHYDVTLLAFPFYSIALPRKDIQEHQNQMRKISIKQSAPSHLRS